MVYQGTMYYALHPILVEKMWYILKQSFLKYSQTFSTYWTPKAQTHVTVHIKKVFLL